MRLFRFRQYVGVAERERRYHLDRLRFKPEYDGIDEIDVQWYLRNRDQNRINEERKIQWDFRCKTLFRDSKKIYATVIPES